MSLNILAVGWLTAHQSLIVQPDITPDLIKAHLGIGIIIILIFNPNLSHYPHIHIILLDKYSYHDHNQDCVFSDIF